MAKKTKTPSKRQPDLALANFLIKLAIDPVVRAAFEKDPEAVVNAEPMSKEAKAAILGKKRAQVKAILAINQQDIIAAARARVTKKPAKKTAKKPKK